jgi:predicted ATPase
LPRLAELLREASEKTQIIVTTHSPELVSAFSDHPEEVVVCERIGGSTEFRRLDPEPLAHWLESYSLGDAWRAGEIGGNRF